MADILTYFSSYICVLIVIPTLVPVLVPVPILVPVTDPDLQPICVGGPDSVLVSGPVPSRTVLVYHVRETF